MGRKRAVRLRDGVSWVKSGGEPGYLFAARTGGVFALNTTGAAIVRGIEAGADRARLVADLLSAFRTEELEAGEAVDAFLASLSEHGLAET
jgi:hypothetical protein